MSDIEWQKKIERELGGVQTRLDSFEKKQDDMGLKVDELHKAAIKMRGGWWVLTVIGGLGVATGTLFAKFGIGVK